MAGDVVGPAFLELAASSFNTGLHEKGPSSENFYGRGAELRHVR
jgi:hypothetical protein